MVGVGPSGGGGVPATLTDKTLVNPTISGVAVASDLIEANITGAATIDFTSGQKQKLTLTDNVTGITWVFPGGGKPGNYVLLIPSTAYTCVWTDVKWPAATAPDLAAGAGATLIGIFHDGTSTTANIYGTFSEDVR